MKTLAEIEAALDSLPPKDLLILSQKLEERLRTGPSCYELKKEIFEEPGYLGYSGLGDLSTNKKYFKDFGRSNRKTRRSCSDSGDARGDV